MERYWKISPSIIVFDDQENEVSGIVNEHDVSGRWTKYLAWVAEGNIAEEWTGE